MVAMETRNDLKANIEAIRHQHDILIREAEEKRAKIQNLPALIDAGNMTPAEETNIRDEIRFPTELQKNVNTDGRYRRVIRPRPWQKAEPVEEAFSTAGRPPPDLEVLLSSDDDDELPQFYRRSSPPKRTSLLDKVQPAQSQKPSQVEKETARPANTRDDLTREPTDGAESSELSELETEPELPAAEIAAGFDADLDVDLDADSEAEPERLYSTPIVSSAPSRSTRPRIWE